MSAQIVFAGTPQFAVPTLCALRASGAAITCVLTQPDRPAGRGRRLQESPVKVAAAALPVRQPDSLSDPAQIADFGPRPDLLVVVAYGLILPVWLLEWPRRGAVNVHASLLPRWRGAAPIQRAILAGDSCTGVSIMQMEAALDTGPVYASAQVPIGADVTAPQLHDTLAQLGATQLVAVLPSILDGTAQPVPQDDSGANYAAKLRKSEARIDWREPAAAIDRKIRAFAGWPVAESTLSDGQRLRISEAEPIADLPRGEPGLVVSAGGAGIVVNAGDGGIRITRVQPPGGRVMDASAWLAAHRLTNARFITPT